MKEMPTPSPGSPLRSEMSEIVDSVDAHVAQIRRLAFCIATQRHLLCMRPHRDIADRSGKLRLIGDWIVEMLEAGATHEVIEEMVLKEINTLRSWE
jgi:hypothetical protein